MDDIFKLFHVENKEDAYTFCLQAFIDNSESYRKKASKYWGFGDENPDYYVFRKAITINRSKSGIRGKIIPDLVLYNKTHISVIESKMFSQEGYMQSEDYEVARDAIIAEVTKENGAIISGSEGCFFYLTLA